jgi:hypothetical protein
MKLLPAAVHESVVGTFRTCRDFPVESAFGGKAEVGFRARQGQLLAQSVRSAIAKGGLINGSHSTWLKVAR